MNGSTGMGLELNSWQLRARALAHGPNTMTTKLIQPLRREIEIDGEPFTVVLTTRGVRLSRKRFRQGRLVPWRALWEFGELERPEGTPGVARRIQ